eukprot:sb/3470042/
MPPVERVCLRCIQCTTKTVVQKVENQENDAKPMATPTPKARQEVLDPKPRPPKTMMSMASHVPNRCLEPLTTLSNLETGTQLIPSSMDAVLSRSSSLDELLKIPITPVMGGVPSRSSSRDKTKIYSPATGTALTTASSFTDEKVDETALNLTEKLQSEEMEAEPKYCKLTSSTLGMEDMIRTPTFTFGASEEIKEFYVREEEKEKVTNTCHCDQ